MTESGRMNFLDALAVISFAIGLANYDENIGQSDMQNAVSFAVSDIHSHLADQDEKINKLIALLEKNGGE